MHPLLRLRKFGATEIYGSRKERKRFYASQFNRTVPLSTIKLENEIYKDPSLIESQAKKLKMEIIESPKEKALKILKEQAERIVECFISYKFRRDTFNKHIKAQLHEDWKHNRCGSCKTHVIHHVHHIVQLQNGGSNKTENLIGLCRHCHSQIHPWLKAA